jgi:hypothetical protein
VHVTAFFFDLFDAAELELRTPSRS